MSAAAILIAPQGVDGARDGAPDPLQGLVARLSANGIAVTVVEELSAAVEISTSFASPPCVLLDLRDAAGGEIEDVRLASDALHHVREALPAIRPIAVLDDAAATTIVACIRAGAGDVIDLRLEGTAAATAVVQRLWDEQAAQAAEFDLRGTQRAMIEDLLRDLIRTERRSIDAEEQLAAHTRKTGEEMAAVDRAPAILLVEHDRGVADQLADLLEAAGVTTFAYVTGEEAVREADTLAETTGLDLALVAVQLPGIDGLEAVRRLRTRIPGLPAFLMTSFVDTALATSAADLGVVGFVQKPLIELDVVVARLAQLALESLQRTREHDYLERIKARHERVLARYRALPREV